jgi:hypothetical protein
MICKANSLFLSGANYLGKCACATTEDNRHALVREDRLIGCDELSVMLTLLL